MTPMHHRAPYSIRREESELTGAYLLRIYRWNKLENSIVYSSTVKVKERTNFTLFLKVIP